MRPELSVILPVRDQADHIAGLLERYRKTLQEGSWEFILVPNACRDDSPALCRKIAKKDRRFRVVENPKGGWGLSVRTGLQAARGDFLCYTNSARTEPSTIAALFNRVKRSPGSLGKVTRHHRGQALRQAGSSLYNLEGRLLFGVTCGDVNGTPKILKSDILGRFTLREDGDLLDLELLALCRRHSIPVLEMPLEGFRRHGGRSSTDLKSALRMLAGAWQLRRRF